MLLLLLVNCEWAQVGIDVNTPHRKYQVKPHSSSWFSAACATGIIHRNHCFHLHQREKSFDSKVKFRQASNRCKRVLEAAKLAYASKTKEPITSQKLGSCDFWQFANGLLNKGKSAIPPLFNGLEVLSSASDKAKLFAENFSLNSNLDDLGVSLPVSPSTTNLKLHNISATPKMVRKVVMNLDLSKASGPDCIPVVVLKNCALELSYILAELFNKCLKESCFPDCWKVSSMVPVFKNVGKRSTAKNYHRVSLLSVISKVFFFFLIFFFNWDSPHARLNSHYEAWSYKKRSTKRITGYRKSVYKEPTVKRCLLILKLKPLRSYVKGKHSIGREFQSLAVRGKKLLT